MKFQKKGEKEREHGLGGKDVRAVVKNAAHKNLVLVNTALHQPMKPGAETRLFPLILALAET